MMTARQYEESLRKLKLEVYMFGKRIENVVDDPIIRPSMNAVAATYELAQRPEWAELMTAVSHLTGKRINRFCHIHQNRDDLVKKSKMGRMLGGHTACCFQRCVGMDALNALSIVTYDIDAKYGTKYNERFLKFLAHVQENDLTCDGAMTDPKGDRGLAPKEQADPDLYLHVVEERPDGIVVSGAKAHQTGAVNSHEIIVMPTVAMREEDKDYAVSFAVPSDTPGITYIIGRQSCDTRKLEAGRIDRGNPFFGGHEALVVFDRVFVPWERVFMYREHEFAGSLVEKFASYHRQSYACKVGVGDVLIGATQTIAEYNGAAKASHVKDKIIEMNQLNETLYCGCIACASEGHQEPSGTYLRRHASGQCAQAERHPVSLRNRPPRPGHRRRPDGHPALGGGSPFTGGRKVDRKILPGRRRRPRGGPDAHPAADRKPHAGVRRRGIPHGIDARRRFAPGAADHDFPPGRYEGEAA